MAPPKSTNHAEFKLPTVAAGHGLTLQGTHTGGAATRLTTMACVEDIHRMSQWLVYSQSVSHAWAARVRTLRQQQVGCQPPVAGAAHSMRRAPHPHHAGSHVCGGLTSSLL